MTGGSGEGNRVVLGRVIGPFGTRGWIKVRSGTDPPENILRYAPWQVERSGRWCRIGLAEGRMTGSGVVVRLEGCHDRDQAVDYSGCEIAVDRSRFPSLEDGEFYWTDLVGLRVINTEGVDLGRIERMMETGANDVMVVRGATERLIPFLTGSVVQSVDFDDEAVVVDWHQDD